MTELISGAATSITRSIIADSESQFGFAFQYPEFGTYNLTLLGPTGRVDLESLAIRTSFPIGVSATNSLTGETNWYFISQEGVTTPGSYALIITANNPSAMKTRTAQLIVWNEAPLMAVVALNTYDLTIGKPYGFNAWIAEGDSLSDADGVFSNPHTAAARAKHPLLTGARTGRMWQHVSPPPRSAAIKSVAGRRLRVTDAHVNIVDPNDNDIVVPMHDDGLEGDTLANDGIWTVSVTATIPGEYEAQIVMQGIDDSGDPFVRSITHSFTIVNDTVTLNGHSGVAHPVVSSAAAYPALSAPQRAGVLSGPPRPSRVSVASGAFGLHADPLHHSALSLEEATDAVDVLLFVDNALMGKYIAYTELYGRNGTVPIGWFGGMSLVWEGIFDGVSRQYVYVTIDGSWLSDAAGPYTLRNTFIRDPDTQSIVSVAQRIISLPAAFDVAASVAGSAAREEALADDTVFSSGLAAAAAARAALPHTLLERYRSSVSAIYGRPPASLYSGAFLSPRNLQTANDRRQTLIASPSALASTAAFRSRPRFLQMVKSSAATGSAEGVHGTVLSHGYCSDVNPFKKHEATFTNHPIFFLDPLASRSNDEFALRLVSFAVESKLTSYVIVAHSQGGVAGSHVMNFYWSGLDKAVFARLSEQSPRAVPVYPRGYSGRYGRRPGNLTDVNGRELRSSHHDMESSTVWPVMSVGTPFQGNTAAGDWAKVAKVFGVGCGTNYDMSTSGMSLWNSGIVDATRSRVHYATTTYKLGNTFGDYCNLAVQSVLEWPNDGTAEFVKTSFLGAHSLGNSEKESVLPFPFDTKCCDSGAVFSHFHIYDLLLPLRSYPASPRRPLYLASQPVASVVHPRCHSVSMRYDAQYHSDPRNTLFNTHSA